MVTASTLITGAGTANAAVWQCNGDSWCTTVINRTDVNQYAEGDGAIYYYVNPGEVVELWCHGSTVYLGKKPGFRHGWISGYDLATGHDPNPNLPPCI